MTDGIKLSLHISLAGRSIEGASSRANFHFEEKEGGLRLYLPKDDADREVCFESDLPRRLCRFLSITDPEAPGVIGGVFRKDNLSVIDRILEKEGVTSVNCDFAALDAELGVPEDELQIEALAEATSNVRLSTPNSAPRSYTPSGWASWKDKQSRTVNSENGGDLRTSSPSHQELRRDALGIAYKKILENVVNTARHRAGRGCLETVGNSPQGSMVVNALPLETIRDAFAARTQDRDFKLGAAGELYMFELLKGLDLPDFGLMNWKSAIRDRVRIHADYSNLEKDDDRTAIADIEYLDSSNKLTQHLISKGHLAPGTWASERPFYHIEVKATTSSNWQEAFFMSKYQERHVRTPFPLKTRLT